MMRMTASRYHTEWTMLLFSDAPLQERMDAREKLILARFEEIGRQATAHNLHAGSAVQGSSPEEEQGRAHNKQS